jgi:hypothetical protein
MPDFAKRIKNYFVLPKRFLLPGRCSSKLIKLALLDASGKTLTANYFISESTEEKPKAKEAPTSINK